MVTVVVVPDGAPDPRGADRTCLEEAVTPTLDRIAAAGALQRARTIPEGLAPGTEVGLPGVLGVKVRRSVPRGLIEAAGAGIAVRAGDAAWRLDLFPRTALEPAALAGLAAALAPFGARVHALGDHRLLLVGPASWGEAPPGPHQTERPLSDLARGPFADVVGAGAAALSHRSGRRPVIVWPWGSGGGEADLPDVTELLGRDVTLIAEGGAAVGLGRLLGCTVVKAPPQEAVGVAAAADDDTVVVVHCAAPDEAAHERDRSAKVEAISEIDREILDPLVRMLERRGGSLMVAPDHGCDPRTGRHTPDPVPVAVWAPDSNAAKAGAPRMTERHAERLPAVPVHALLPEQIRLSERAA